MYIVKKANAGVFYHWSAASGEESNHPFCPTGDISAVSIK